MVIARLYRMEPIHSGTHFIVNLSPDQEILSVYLAIIVTARIAMFASDKFLSATIIQCDMDVVGTIRRECYISRRFSKGF